MHRVKRSAPLYIVLLSLSASTEARTLAVGTGGEFDTLTAAGTASVTGDVISVAEGVYDGTRGEVFPIHLERPIWIQGNEAHNKPVIRGNLDGSLLIAEQIDGITLENLCIREGGGDSRPAVECSEGMISVTSCVFEGNSARYGTNALFAHGSTVRLNDCAIANNRTTEGSLYSRVAIRFESTSATIEDCVISSNDSGGIWCYEGELLLAETQIRSNGGRGASIGDSIMMISDCAFDNNSGGGLAVSNCEPGAHIQRALFRENGSYFGCSLRSCGTGGLDLLFLADAVQIHNCVFDGNLGDGSLFVGWARAIVTNCVFVGGSGWGSSINANRSSACSAANCIIDDSTPFSLVAIGGELSVTYSNIKGGYPGIGNISSDPLLRDAENGDFRLFPNSPCIDSASVVGPLDDFAGNPRPVDIPGIGREGNGAFDMGAYEFQLSDLPTPTPSITPTPSVTSTPTETGTSTVTPTPTFNTDINRDGRVDAIDLLILWEDLGKESSH